MIPIAEDLKKTLSAPISDLEFKKNGGQKAFYKAVIDGKHWALKLIPLDESFNGERYNNDDRNEIRQRLNRELSILKRGNIENIVKLGPLALTEIKLSEKNYLVYTEELLPGEDLYQLINGKNRPSKQEMKALLASIINAIEFLWSIETIHRDIKPLNIMRCSSDRFVLLDPGYAFEIHGVPITKSKFWVGTLNYFSPEQLNLAQKSNLDFRSDMYSLGISAYEYATGNHPYVKHGFSQPDIIKAICNVNPPDISGLRSDFPKELCEAIHLLLKKPPHFRHIGRIKELIRKVN